MGQSTILFVGEEPSLAGAVREGVRPLGGLRILEIDTIDEALDSPFPHDLALAVVHLRCKGEEAGAASLLRAIQAMGRPAGMIVVPEPEMAGRALDLIRMGAVDSLPRPLDLARLHGLLDILTVRHRVATPGPAAPPAGPKAGAIRPTGSSPLILRSPRMRAMMGQVQRVAVQDATILLGGETGTGKTRLARLIHEMSPRRDEPFLVVNCGALSSNLAESEMFGHVRGAFTGADRDRVGRFQEVGRGTLLLDEVDMLGPEVQAKLLRVIEERVFEPVGSSRLAEMHARLIAASNRPLEREVAEGRFRSDLYFRLNVVGFELPLRQRREGIAPMARRFIDEFSARNGRAPLGLSAGVARALLGYDWPGNIRELRNVIERAVALSVGPEIVPGDLPEAVARAAGSEPTPGRALGGDSAEFLLEADAGADALGLGLADQTTLARAKHEAEAARIVQALEKHGNNRLRAASELGISRMTLYKKLYKYGMMGPSGDSARPGRLAGPPRMHP